MNDNVLQQTLGATAVLRSQATRDDPNTSIELRMPQQAWQTKVADLVEPHRP